MNANVWITFLDPKGCIVVWNKAAEEISGYTADEVMESNEIWKKLYPDPEYRKVVTKKINDTLQNRKKLENFETIILTKGALKKQISWNTREILDQNGDIIGYIAMGRDITEIVSLGKQFRTLLMNANVWVAFLDPQSKIEVWNRAAEEISGYTADEVIGSNEIWKKLYPDQEYRKELTEKIIDIISNKKSLTNFESNIVTKNKEKRVISWNTREIRDDENKIMGFVATGRDITNIINLQRKFGTLLMNANV
ncbi:MAG: PAS domain-containing protein, partial [Methanogenium sp.]|nr:PAS domain-containing protein [Methanogenium sp.]